MINTLEKRWVGHGHNIITIEVDGDPYGTTTTNTLAIDAAFDDCYDDEDNTGRYYESQKEAQEALVGEILTANYL